MWIINYVASTILQVETFPCFDIAHNLLAAVELRNVLGDNNRESLSRNHPFVSWLLTIAFIFSGSLTANLLLGEPVIAPLENTKQLVVATIIWYLVFLTSSDIVYKAGTSFPIKVIASSINEIYRARKLGNGILQASKFYPNSWIIMIAIATIRANGSGLVKLFIRQMRKMQTPKDVGFMQLSFTTKISMLAAFFLVFERKTAYFGSLELLHFAITLFFVYIKICSLYETSFQKGVPNWFSNTLFKKISINRTELPDSLLEQENLKDTQKID